MKQCITTLALVTLIGLASLQAQLEDNNIIGFVETPTHVKNDGKDKKSALSEKTLNTSSQNLVSIAPTRIYNFAQISYILPKKGKVSIEIHSLEGKKVKTIASDTLEKGKYQKTIQVKGLEDGVYHLVLVMDGYKETKRIIIAR